MSTRYTPSTLPYHIIVPSLVDYTLSSGPPLDRDWTGADTSRIMHKLLVFLGFKAYAVQGDDVGSTVARMMGVRYEECKAVHLNADVSGRSDDVPDSEITEREC
jgi:microsomal epoxide hydrolase